MARAILLGGPDHGKMIDDVKSFPVLTPEPLRNQDITTPGASFKTNTYFERRIIVCDRETKIGVYSDLVDGRQYGALLFTTLVKEVYHELFWRH
jgi:hypothetical protein